MKVYCINLDRRPDRLAHMIRECGRLGIAFERVAATDGASPEVAARATGIPVSHWGWQMSAPAYACLQSHCAVWRRIVESGEPGGMVLEDDVILAADLGRYLQDGWVPADADLVKLETFGGRIHLSKAATAISAGRHLHRLRSGHPGTAGYVVSAVAAARLLDASQTTGDPVDEFMFNEELPFFATACIYQMHPAPIIQGDRSTVRQDWGATDIAVRAGASVERARSPETAAQRLSRRLCNEVTARLRGTRYVVVRHG